MARSLRVALAGWSLGFLGAGLWGMTQSGSHHLASALLVVAGIGLTAFVVLAAASARHEVPDHHHWTSLDEVDSAESIPPPLRSTPPVEKPAVTPTVPASEHIATLEARLAAEQEQLDVLIHALAEADAAAMEAGSGGSPVVEDPRPIELEPVLRRQVIDALAELVGRGESDLLGELNRLTSPGQR